MRGTEEGARIERFLGLVREFGRGAGCGGAGDLDKAASTAQRYCSAAVGLLAELGEGYRIFVALFLGRAANALRRTGADGLGVGSVIRRRDEARVAPASPDRGTRVQRAAGAFDARSRSRDRIWRSIPRGIAALGLGLNRGFQNVMRVADISDISGCA